MEEDEIQEILSRLALELSKTRFDRGLSRVELTGHSGVSHNAIVQVELARSAPTVRTLVKLAEALKPADAKTGEFLGRLIARAVDNA